MLGALESDPGRHPGPRWPLTAPESFALLRLGCARGSGRMCWQIFGRDAFKLALRELVARRALLFEEVETTFFGMLWDRRSTLTPGPRYASLAEPSLVPLLELHRRVVARRSDAAAPRTGAGGDVARVSVRDLVKEVLRHDMPGPAASNRDRRGRLRSWKSFGEYWERDLPASLVRRGLVRREDAVDSGLLARMRYTLTPAGRAAAESLRRWTSWAREHFSALAREDPSRALANARQAGAAVLLTERLYPDLERLAERGSLDGLAFEAGVLTALDSEFESVIPAFGTTDQYGRTGPPLRRPLHGSKTVRRSQLDERLRRGLRRVRWKPVERMLAPLGASDPVFAAAARRDPAGTERHAPPSGAEPGRGPRRAALEKRRRRWSQLAVAWLLGLMGFYLLYVLMGSPPDEEARSLHIALVVWGIVGLSAVGLFGLLGAVWLCALGAMRLAIEPAAATVVAVLVVASALAGRLLEIGIAGSLIAVFGWTATLVLAAYGAAWAFAQVRPRVGVRAITQALIALRAREPPA